MKIRAILDVEFDFGSNKKAAHEALAALINDPASAKLTASMRVLNCSDLGYACRVCSCTDWDACEGGCSWVEKDLCSACAPPKVGKKGRKSYGSGTPHVVASAKSSVRKIGSGAKGQANRRGAANQ